MFCDMSPSKRVLVSEGSSLSGRQAITALGMADYRIGVCDPDPLCIGRFSHFVTHYYQCPAVGKDPWGYLWFVIEVLAKGQWDVLLPTHEQAFLFSRERSHIPRGVAFALAEFSSFLQVQGKSGLVETLSHLSIPQPVSRVIQTQAELEHETRFPFYLKADYATASTAIWRIHTIEELQSRSSLLFSLAETDGSQRLVVQEPAKGVLERVQAIFDRGKLVASHGYRQRAEGLRGGDIAKVCVSRPVVQSYVERLGAHLQWHGALSLDYIFQEDRGIPLFIDANPRLVEPMNAVFCGVNLAEILVQVSTCQTTAAAEPVAYEIRTHMLLMALLSAADVRKSRLDIIVEFMRAITRRGIFADSREELLPIQTDFKCLFPLLYVLARLFWNPGAAAALSTGSIASYSLSPLAARQIADMTYAPHIPHS